MRYSLPARLMHWLMALAFLFMWVSGFALNYIVEDETPMEDFFRGTHVSMGVLVTALLVLRIVVRLTHRAPPLPAEIRGLERKAAHWGHAALYLLPAAVVALGWAQVNIGDHDVEWFGTKLPRVFPTAEAWEDFTEGAHMWMAYAMLAFALGHVAAALKHRYLDGHDVFYRMTFGRAP
ncbi:MAG: cytochrome b [bacterium]|nr:cytochrome b [bacterium]